METSYSSGVVEITTTSAIVFVVVASCFLVMLYEFMSSTFIEVLVVLFAIGGVEVCNHSHIAVIPFSLSFLIFCELNEIVLRLLFRVCKLVWALSYHGTYVPSTF